MFIDIHKIIEDFFHHLEECLTNLAKENKEVYICGYFNFDLIKVDTDNFTQYFFTLLCSYGFLPHKLQPTRVSEHTATVIDNIFSNNLQDDILSDNVLLTLSDHFAQMVSVNREQIDSKKSMCIKEITQSFQERVSEMMFQFKIGVILTTM